MSIFSKKDEEKKEDTEDVEQVKGKYNEPCSLCNKAPTDKKWGGQYFHKKCFRRMRKSATKML